MTLRQAGTGLRTSSLRREDTPRERTIFDAIIDLIAASPHGLTNTELAEALELSKREVTDATWRLLMKGKLRVLSARPGDPLRFGLPSWARRAA